ncbi:riboflavin kinase [Mycena metata]|uniref:Riboflavin kinase n=1 Tax=Mycena metata TaxID=1033252 RepID=A0AAD7HIN7_9AGAR|nr:riboflavin kinase [Mycena metata]KAJ7745789.1 riboflavin kinase [Mycena metata]KAJ7773489.1 riboflavin kinase [Mycena metata]
MATARSLIIGPSTGPEAPYPCRWKAKISGFGRGSKELGIPNANLPAGVYFGWTSLRLPPSHPNHPETHSGFSIYPMVMSIGNNPYYNNTVRSAEAHLLHDFGADFYGVEMRLLITGFIREEKTTPSLDREGWALRETDRGPLDGSWLLRETPEQNRAVV